MKKIALIFVIILCVILSFFTYEAYAQRDLVPDGYEKMLENDNYSLYINLQTTQFFAENNATGQKTFSNPQNIDSDENIQASEKTKMKALVTATFIDTKQVITETVSSYTDSVREGSFKVSEGKASLLITYIFEPYGIEIPLLITLTDSGFTVTVSRSRIKEQSDFKIFELSVLQYLGAAFKGEKGYIFVPDGTGGIIDFDHVNPAAPYYRQAVYGRDLNFSPDFKTPLDNTVKLPVFGICSQKGGVMGVITSGAGDAEINATPSGLGGSSYAGAIFNLRGNDVFSLSGVSETRQDSVIYYDGKLPETDYTITYFELSPSKSDYVGMAGIYKEHLLSEKKINKADSKDFPLMITSYGAVRKKKHFLGIPYNGTEKLTTYAEAADMIKLFEEAGIEKTELIYRYSSDGTVNQKPMKTLNTIGTLGGSSGFKKLLDYSQSSGNTVLPEINLESFSTKNTVFTYLNGVKTISGLPVKQLQYGITTNFKRPELTSLSFLKSDILLKNVEKLSKSLQKTSGLSGVYILGAAHNTYSDFSKNSKSKAEMSDILGGAIEKLPVKVVAENANEYALKNARNVILPDASCLDIITQNVPFYQIALSGVISYTSKPINLDSKPGEAFLKALETGALIHYSLISRDTELLRDTELSYLISCDLLLWKDMIVLQQKKLSEFYAKTGDHVIIGHKSLKPGVFETVYQNGVRIITNYNEEDFLIDAVTVQGNDAAVIV